MPIYWEHFDKIENLALKAVKGESLPKDYVAKLIPHTSPVIDGDLTYIRIAILRDGVEVGDVGLAFKNGGWIIAGSGYMPL